MALLDRWKFICLRFILSTFWIPTRVEERRHTTPFVRDLLGLPRTHQGCSNRGSDVQ